MGTTVKGRLPKELAPTLCPHTFFLVLLTLAGVEQLHQMIGKQFVKVGQSLKGAMENLGVAVVFRGLRLLEEREFQLHLAVAGCPHDDPPSYGEEWKESGGGEALAASSPGRHHGPSFLPSAAERSEGHNSPELSLEP